MPFAFVLEENLVKRAITWDGKFGASCFALQEPLLLKLAYHSFRSAFLEKGKNRFRGGSPYCFESGFHTRTQPCFLNV
jgi:hypothetical protein